MTARNFSQHAMQRMDERNITNPMIEAVLRRGLYRPDPSGEALRATLCGITAVVNPDGMIVTVFEREFRPARASPKRLARLAGKAKHRWGRDNRRNGGCEHGDARY